MVKKQDFKNISAYDSAFDSEILSESLTHVTSENGLLPEARNDAEFQTSTASNFDFEIFSESGKILRDLQMASIADQFPDISFAEERIDYKPDSYELTEEEKISEFAYRLLHGDY